MAKINKITELDVALLKQIMMAGMYVCNDKETWDKFVNWAEAFGRPASAHIKSDAGREEYAQGVINWNRIMIEWESGGGELN